MVLAGLRHENTGRVGKGGGVGNILSIIDLGTGLLPLSGRAVFGVVKLQVRSLERSFLEFFKDFSRSLLVGKLYENLPGVIANKIFHCFTSVRAPAGDLERTKVNAQNLLLIIL